jgi:hypothetical protein
MGRAMATWNLAGTSSSGKGLRVIIVPNLPASAAKVHPTTFAPCLIARQHPPIVRSCGPMTARRSPTVDQRPPTVGGHGKIILPCAPMTGRFPATVKPRPSTIGRYDKSILPCRPAVAPHGAAILPCGLTIGTHGATILPYASIIEPCATTVATRLKMAVTPRKPTIWR